LKAYLFIAVAGWRDEIENYFPGYNGSISPVNTFFGIELFHVDPSEFQKAGEAESARIIAEGERNMEAHRLSIEARQASKAAATSESHRAEVAALSEKHDRLRADAEAERAAKVNSAPVQQVRIVQ
jgi:hypothetical protein